MRTFNRAAKALWLAQPYKLVNTTVFSITLKRLCNRIWVDEVMHREKAMALMLKEKKRYAAWTRADISVWLAAVCISPSFPANVILFNSEPPPPHVSHLLPRLLYLGQRRSIFSATTDNVPITRLSLSRRRPADVVPFEQTSEARQQDVIPKTWTKVASRKILNYMQ